jgi:probable rRNA maturation factor
MAVSIEVNREAGVPGLGADAVERTVANAARAVLDDFGVTRAELSITLLDDTGMATLNREWKGRDGPTDVLAFALYEEGEDPVGDIYLGVERGAEQGAAVGETMARELARLAIHGTLHVLGFDHPEDDREGTEMWAHQERILNGLDPG